MPIYTIKLIKSEPIARNTLVFTFEKPSHFSFIPGQYGGFTLINPVEKDKGGVTRRFSLLSTPTDPHLAILTRIQNSAFKRTLQNMSSGNEIKFAGPTGNFVLHDDPTIPAVFIAGGIGIAPFYSIIRHTLNEKSSRIIYLFYGNQQREDSAFLLELAASAAEHPNFKFIPTLDKADPAWQGETGFISHTMLKKHIPDLTLPIFYVCGAPGMVTALQETLVEMGIAEDKIKVEDFPGY